MTWISPLARLSKLVEVGSEVLGIPLKTGREIGRRAREAGWIRSGARGFAAPEMNANDAANWLLGVMGGNEVLRAGEAVALCRRLQFYMYSNRKEFADVPEPAPEDFFGLGEGHMFHEALERMIQWATDHGNFIYPPWEVPITIVRIAVQRPTPLADIDLYCAGHHLWTAHYVDSKYEVTDGMSDEEFRELARELRAEYGGGGLVTAKTIGDETLYAIGNCLAGRPPMEIPGK